MCILHWAYGNFKKMQQRIQWTRLYWEIWKIVKWQTLFLHFRIANIHRFSLILNKYVWFLKLVILQNSIHIKSRMVSNLYTSTALNDGNLEMQPFLPLSQYGPNICSLRSFCSPASKLIITSPGLHSVQIWRDSNHFQSWY